VEVFTTRPDTIFGVSFMVLAPEHELVSQITTAEQKAEVEAYIAKAKARSDSDRMADVKTVRARSLGRMPSIRSQARPFRSGSVTMCLAGYGTGAVMAVPEWRPARLEFREAFRTCPSHR
jgi:leucyl-tRNA synthetase